MFKAWQVRGLALVVALMVMVPMLIGTRPAKADSPTTATADLNLLKALVLNSTTKTVGGQPQVGYRIRFLSGSLKGQAVNIDSAILVNGIVYHQGDHVMVQIIDRFDGTKQYVISDYDRQSSLWWLAILFVLVIAWFSRWHGLRSVIGLVFSFVVIIGWVIPEIATGGDPVTVSLLGSAAVLIVGFVITEGFTRLAWASILGTVLTMAVIGLLSQWAIFFTHLTGFGSEEAFYLQGQNGTVSINLRGLLLAGIIIGTLGILEDVAVSQVATIGELRSANPGLSRWELYQAGMRVGRSHLAAIINTLTLAYAGSALPLLLLFHLGGQPGSQIVNSEIVATEIVRSIIGSIGLIMALPITTACAILIHVSRAGGGHVHSQTMPLGSPTHPELRA